VKFCHIDTAENINALTGPALYVKSIKEVRSQAWWYMPVILALRRLK
jgi:hypothetical protein